MGINVVSAQHPSPMQEGNVFRSLATRRGGGRRRRSAAPIFADDTCVEDVGLGLPGRAGVAFPFDLKLITTGSTAVIEDFLYLVLVIGRGASAGEDLELVDRHVAIEDVTRTVAENVGTIVGAAGDGVGTDVLRLELIGAVLVDEIDGRAVGDGSRQEGATMFVDEGSPLVLLAFNTLSNSGVDEGENFLLMLFPGVQGDRTWIQTVGVVAQLVEFAAEHKAEGRGACERRNLIIK